MTYQIWRPDDTRDHILKGPSCPCGPIVFYKNGEMIVLHRPHDEQEWTDSTITLVGRARAAPMTQERDTM